MIAALDNTFLTLLLNPTATPRPNPQTGEAVTHCRHRIEGLIDRLSSDGSSILIPAPCLAEALTRSEAAESYFEALQSYSIIEIAEFNARAAFELARMIRSAIGEGDKRSAQEGNWQEIKMDRLIVGVAVAHGATTFYTDDSRQSRFASMAGLKVTHTWDLPLPDDRAQQSLMDGVEDQWPKQGKPPKATGPETPPIVWDR